MDFTHKKLELVDVQRQIKDKALASECFVTLCQLEEAGAVKLYRPHGWSTRKEFWWNVWANDEARRYTLAEWCQEWLAGRNGGAQ